MHLQPVRGRVGFPRECVAGAAVVSAMSKDGALVKVVSVEFRDGWRVTVEVSS
jgi:hypothetical protein